MSNSTTEKDALPTTELVVYGCTLHLAGGLWSKGVMLSGSCRINDRIYQFTWRDTDHEMQLEYNPHHSLDQEYVEIFDEYPFTREDLQARYGYSITLDIYWDILTGQLLAFGAGQQQQDPRHVEVYYLVEADFQ